MTSSKLIVREKNKYESRVPKPAEPYPDFVPERTNGPPPARTRGRHDFFVYFMVGPMSEALNGYPTAPEFNLLQPTSTTDRKDTNRERQRQVMKAQRLVRVRVRITTLFPPRYNLTIYRTCPSSLSLTDNRRKITS